jgi:hypothetical protein
MGARRVIIVTCTTPGSITPETEKAIEEHWTSWGNDWNVYYINKGYPQHYGEILAHYWEKGEDFCVVEPDIVIREDVADALHGCSCTYGCFPYAWGTHIGPALGCTWFRSQFLAEHPNAMKDSMHVGWRQLDVVLMRHVLARNGIQPHIHNPQVEHLNPLKQAVENAIVLDRVPER